MNSILAMSSDNHPDLALNSDEESQLTRTNTILGKMPSIKKVPSSNIEFALNKVEQFTLARDHEDIDINLNIQEEPTDEQWTQFIEQFYAAAQ
jgi:hypothetical protein